MSTKIKTIVCASIIRKRYLKPWKLVISFKSSRMTKKTSRNREWHLPHHPVTNPNKSGKVRKRLNGASKFHRFSLNKSLLVGTHLLQGLQFFLLRFLQHKFVISADIEEKFLQVGTLPEEQPSLPFLWPEEPSTEVMVYQYTLQIFGGHDSPTCANFALQQTA